MIGAVIILATTMAIFGVLGYLKGSRWAFFSLLFLFGAFVLVERRPDAIVAILNMMYTGVMLTLGGGLGALASGDFDEVQTLLNEIEPFFTAANENLALLLVIFAAVGMGLLLSLIMKSRASVWGLIWGLVYGYILSAAALPLIISDPAAQLPVPILRPAERSATAAATSQGPTALDQLFSTLSEPQNAQIVGIAVGVFIVLLLLLTVRSGVKSGAKKKG